MAGFGLPSIRPMPSAAPGLLHRRRGGVALLYSLNGQTIEAEPNGSFVIANVAVPDVQAPYNVGDDCLRIIGVLPTNQGTQYGCPIDDWTLYLFSQSAFQITVDAQTGRFKYIREPNQVQIRRDPPPLPESIKLQTVGGQPVLGQWRDILLYGQSEAMQAGFRDTTNCPIQSRSCLKVASMMPARPSPGRRVSAD